MRFVLFFFLNLNVLTYGQTIIHHQALSSQGVGVKLKNGIYVNQTIGQQNVIGNYSKKGYTYGQGYQQGLRKKDIRKSIFPTIAIINYPNPFFETINFQFSEPMKDIITVSIYDVLGKMVFQQKKNTNENILTLQLAHLPVGNYIVQLSALNYTYSTKIIKQL